MTFIDPSLSKVFDTLVNNDKIIDFLKEYGIIITKSRLYDSYTPEQVEKMEAEIYTSNVSTLYEIAEILLKYSDIIKENDVWYLLSNKVAWDELAYAAGTTPAHFSVDVYKEIIYTYKYCYAKSFFQNNTGNHSRVSYQVFSLSIHDHIYMLLFHLPSKTQMALVNNNKDI